MGGGSRLLLLLVLGAIEVLRNAVGVGGGGCQLSRKKAL